MEWRLVIDMAGGAAPTTESSQREASSGFAVFNGELEGDRREAAPALADLHKLDHRRYGEQRYAALAYHLVKKNWPAVERLAKVAIRDRFIPANKSRRSRMQARQADDLGQATDGLRRSGPSTQPGRSCSATGLSS